MFVHDRRNALVTYVIASYAYMLLVLSFASETCWELSKHFGSPYPAKGCAYVHGIHNHYRLSLPDRLSSRTLHPDDNSLTPPGEQGLAILRSFNHHGCY
jgi:hypothetical protein